MKSLSSGFSGGSTKQISGFDREVEQRLGKLTRMDVFTDDFSPPGTAQSFPGADFSKRNAPYGKPHDDTIPENNNRVKVSNELAKVSKHLAEVGDPKIQAYMDELDAIQHQINAPIKNPYDQFPGALHMDKPNASEVAKFDVHATDPTRLRQATGAENFHSLVEQRFKEMVNGQPKSDNADLNDQRLK